MKKSLVVALTLCSAVGAAASSEVAPPRGGITLSEAALLDKIKGGWAGQVIGCTFGGPTEFVFQSTFIPERQAIPWSADAIRWSFENRPGLYDDVYMDLTFVEVLEESGLDAPAAAFARKFAAAPYPLWHANQMARYNILNGIAPPRSGHWLDNPHADDIDFQIEADFAGLMSPGLVGAAARVCDRVGHIMNSGDGYYGGLFVAAMYALAFVESDVHKVVDGALVVVPADTAFSRTIRAVIDGHALHPADWPRTWFEVERAWGDDRGCPEGVFRPFNIDARMNAAWAVMGLLYGDGDFGKTLEVSARGGDDSDCNPATAGGVLGTILGLEKIPAGWKAGLEPIRGRAFPYTRISLDEAGALSFKHALRTIARNGGGVNGDTISIPVENVKAVPREESFAGHFPVGRRGLGTRLNARSPEAGIEFEGIGFAVNGAAAAVSGVPEADPGPNDDAVPVMTVQVDGGPAETLRLPLDYRIRKPTLFWKYRLKPGRHTARFRLVRGSSGDEVRLDDIVIYGDRPAAPPP